MTPVALVRRWAVDWLGGQHPEVCDGILAPDYALLIGGYLLGPREQYVPATLAQLPLPRAGPDRAPAGRRR